MSWLYAHGLVWCALLAVAGLGIALVAFYLESKYLSPRSEG